MAHKRTKTKKRRFTKKEKEIIKELKERISKVDLSDMAKGKYHFYLSGSLLKGNFTKSSDIDVFVVETIGADWLMGEEKEIEKRLGKEIKGHPIHVWTTFSYSDATDFGEKMMELDDRRW